MLLHPCGSRINVILDYISEIFLGELVILVQNSLFLITIYFLNNLPKSLIFAFSKKGRLGNST